MEEDSCLLKEALVKSSVLNLPDPSLPYRLYTDASDKGIIAALTQVANVV